jgi:CHAD domain-containing protein
MQQQEIVDLIESRFEDIEACFKGILDGFGMEEIHLFRIEIKKLKAFLRLLQIGLKKPDDLRLPKIFNKSYRATGAIRTLQLQRQKIQQVVHEIRDIHPETYLNILTVEASENMIKVENLAKTQKSFLSERKNIITHLPDGLSKKSIRKYTEDTAFDLSELIRKAQLPDKSLHQVRKILKDLQYNWPFTKNLMGKSFPSTVNDKDSIKSFTNRIGNFHDACMALSLLEPNYIDQISNEKERILLLNIKKEWENEKRDIKQQIETELKEFSADPVS